MSRVFLAYLALHGDVNRTALACDMDSEAVSALAEQENWKAKLAQYAALREQDPNLQKQLNRAINYVQTRQLAALVDTVIAHLADPKVLIESLTVYGKETQAFVVKPLTDLVKAAETLQLMSQRALGDVGGPEHQKEVSGASIGLSVINTLNAVSANVGVDAVSIVKQSIAAADDSPNLPQTPSRGAS